MKGNKPDKIIDNSPGRQLKEVIKDRLKNCKEAKFAVGYFFLSGFNLVDEDFPKDVENKPFLKLVMGNETTLPTKEEISEGYNLRELFKQKMIEELQSEKLTEEQKNRLKRLRDYIANGLIEVKLYDKSRLHAKLYLFLKDLDDKYGSPGVAIVGSSNFTAEGLTKNKELNVILTEREDVLYLNKWFDDLWEEAVEFNNDLVKVIEISGVVSGKNYPKLGKYISPEKLFKYLVYKWTDGRVLNLVDKDILLEFQLVGVINAVNILNYYNGVILADSVGLGKSFVASAIIQEFLSGKHPHWIPKGKDVPGVMLILPPPVISQWEDLLIGRSDKDNLVKLQRGEKVKLSSEYFFKNNYKRLVKGDYNYKVYEIYDDKGEKFLGKLAFLSLGLFQKFKAGESKELEEIADEYDLFVVDEAHKFRNKNTNRWKALRSLQKKSQIYDNFSNKFLLLTATPLNNTIDDVYNLIRIFTDDTFMPFRVKNIPIDELIANYKRIKAEYEKKKDDKTKKELKKIASEIKRKILDEVMVLRTRRYILEQFQDIEVNGKKLVFKDPKPYSLDYSILFSDNLKEILKIISENIHRLNFEHTKLYGARYLVFKDDEEKENIKIIEIADLFKLLLGKRLESSIFAFETTLRRIYQREIIFYDILNKSFNKIDNEEKLKKLLEKAVKEAKVNKELEEAEIEFEGESEEENWFDKVIKLLVEYGEGSNISVLSPSEKVKEGLKVAIDNLRKDIELMESILEKLEKLKEGNLHTLPKQEEDLIEINIPLYKEDPKLEALKQLIVNPKYKSDKLKAPSLYGKKFIIFTQYKDTAYYLYHNLEKWIEKEIELYSWLKDKKDKIKVALVTGDTDTTTKVNYIKRFAPKANKGESEAEKYGEIEILIATDALSEGVNLQDADAVVNYDLPWNPMVIVQRVGRVNRIGNEKDIYVINFTPSAEIELIVGILNKLRQKIEDITLVIGKESKILSPDEEINVETFGEKIKRISELSMASLEEYSISEEFKYWFEGGIPQEQLDEYKLLNVIQYKLNLSSKDFEDVENLDNGPYYTYVKSGKGKVYGIYEIYRGDYRIDKRILSISEGGIKVESPLSLLELVRNKRIQPINLDNAAENLKKLDKKMEEEVKKYTKEYKSPMKGFIQELFLGLLQFEKTGKVKEKERFVSVMNTLQMISSSPGNSREIKKLLADRKLIDVKKNNLKILDGNKIIEALYTYFKTHKIKDIHSLEVTKKLSGWFYGY